MCARVQSDVLRVLRVLRGPVFQLCTCLWRHVFGVLRVLCVLLGLYVLYVLCALYAFSKPYVQHRGPQKRASGQKRTDGSQRNIADPERGQLNFVGAAEVVNQAKVLSKKNMKMWRKRPGAPKFVHHFVKLISKLAEEHDRAMEFVPVEVNIWEVLLKCDEKGKKHLKDEERIWRSKEKECKTKEKRRARTKSERAR